MTATPNSSAVPRTAGTRIASLAANATNPNSGFAFAFLIAFVFVSTSRILDATLPFLHIPLVLAIMAAAFAIPCGALAHAFETKVGKLMGLFTLWMVACVPLSQWRGGSVQMLQSTWFKSYVLLLMISGVATSLIRVRRIMATIAISAILVMSIAIIQGNQVEGRLTLESGFLANPNDLAQFLLVGLCFLPALDGKTNSMFRRIPLSFVALGMLYAIFATGSRSALIGLLLVGVVVFFRVPSIQKLALVAVAVAGFAAFLFVTPQSASSRLSILFGDDIQPGSATITDSIAAASAESRKQLLFQSLRLTIENPVFGVGPGIFQHASAEDSHESGQHAMWRETHNSYTQVSSETGLPGIGLFGGAIGACLIGLWRARGWASRSRSLRLVDSELNCLLLGFVAFAVTAVFVSVAYQFNFCMMIGLAAAAIGAAERELPHTAPAFAPALRTPAATPAPKPAPQGTPLPVTQSQSTARPVPSAPRYPKAVLDKAAR